VQGTPKCIKQTLPAQDASSSQKEKAIDEDLASTSKDGEFRVQWSSGQQPPEEEQFDLVLAAVGRAADTTGLNLPAAGVSTTGSSKSKGAAAPKGGASSGDVVLVGPPGTAATANPKV
jgi:pyruvate/2-oxoglutarate dehydrogenase complex dihydrolipoamide dehydrogenase (E3) component